MEEKTTNRPPKLEVDVPALIEKYNAISEEIEEKTKLKNEIFKKIGDNYVLYLKELMKEKDDWYFYDGNCFHLGKFITLKYCDGPGERYTVNNRPYGNMHSAIFEVKEALTGNLESIAAQNKNFVYYPKRLEVTLDYEEMNGILTFRYGYQITKAVYEKAKRGVLSDIEKYSKGEYGDYKCGDKIRYIKRKTFNVGSIVFIKGKTAFLDNGEKVVLSTAQVEHV